MPRASTRHAVFGGTLKRVGFCMNRTVLKWVAAWPGGSLVPPPVAARNFVGRVPTRGVGVGLAGGSETGSTSFLTVALALLGERGSVTRSASSVVRIRIFRVVTGAATCCGSQARAPRRLRPSFSSSTAEFGI